MSWQEPVTAQIQGAGHFTTMMRRVFTFNGNGVYRLLSIPQPGGKKPIEIQLRMEPFPDRTVKYCSLTPAHLPLALNKSWELGLQRSWGKSSWCSPPTPPLSPASPSAAATSTTSRSPSARFPPPVSAPPI